MGGRLEGKVAVVTGGANGIGAGTVRRFVEEGARCVVSDVQDEPGRALAAELGDATCYVHADVAVEADIANLVDAAVLQNFGRLDCMFNNAGILGAVGPIADTTSEAWHRTIDVLLTSVFLGTKYAAGAVVPRRAPARGSAPRHHQHGRRARRPRPARLHDREARRRRADPVRRRRARPAPASA